MLIPSIRIARSRIGLGLFALRPFRRGAFIAEYSGRRITNAEADELEKRGAKYMYEINSRVTIDGSPRSNVARYANHSCRPNAESDIVKGRVILRAIKTIEPGAEITYDYGKQYFDLVLKPIGCKCVKCREKRREEWHRKRRNSRRRRAAAKRRAAEQRAAAAKARKRRTRRKRRSSGQ